MTKNNGIAPHNQGSSIMISTASTMTVLYVGVKLDVSATDCKIALQRNKKKEQKRKTSATKLKRNEHFIFHDCAFCLWIH